MAATNWNIELCPARNYAMSNSNVSLVYKRDKDEADCDYHLKTRSIDHCAS